jgi:hypothetical protein
MTKTGRFVNNFLKKNYGFRNFAWPKLLRRNIFLTFTVCAAAKDRPSLTTMQSGPFQTRRYAVAPLGLKRAACRSKYKKRPEAVHAATLKELKKRPAFPHPQVIPPPQIGNAGRTQAANRMRTGEQPHKII